MTYIFGYGSLINPTSLQKTLPKAREHIPMTLHGFQRKINAPVGNFVYLNIIPNKHSAVAGVAFAVNDEELQLLKRREVGYELIRITELVTPRHEEVFAFIAPDTKHPTHTISQKYLEVCTAHLSEDERRVWFEETLIENPIVDDLTQTTIIVTP